MAKQTVGIGSAANDGTGDPLRVAFDKINDNFTELYNYQPDTALQADGSVDSTGNQLFQGHVAIGADAAVSATTLLTLEETIDAASPVVAVEYVLDIENTGLIGTAATSLYLDTTNSQEPTLVSVATLYGIFVEANQESVEDMLDMYPFFASPVSLAGSGNITGDYAAFFASSPSWNGGKPVDAIAFKANNQGASSITNSYGLHIVKQTGAVNNYGIALLGDDLGADIAFGASQDVRQHFNGTNLEFEGSGIAHTAATVTHDGYVTIAINGVAYNFMTGT